MYPCMTKKENTTERITALHTLTHVYAKLHFAASAPWTASLLIGYEHAPAEQKSRTVTLLTKKVVRISRRAREKEKRAMQAKSENS